MSDTDKIGLKIVCDAAVIDGVPVVPEPSISGTLGPSAELAAVKQDDGSVVVEGASIDVTSGFLNNNDVTFRDCKLHGLTISNCKLYGCECTTCYLYDCEIRGGSLDKTCRVSGGDLYENTTLAGCTVTSSSIHGFTGSPISKCTMKYCTFYGCRLDRINRFGTIVDCVFVDTDGSLKSTNVIDGAKFELAEAITRALSISRETETNRLDPMGLLLPKEYSEHYTAQDTRHCLKFGSSDGRTAVEKVASYIKEARDIYEQEESEAVDSLLQAKTPVVEGFVVLYYGDIVLLFTDSFIDEVVSKFDDEIRENLISMSEFIASLLCVVYPKMCVAKPTDKPAAVIPHLSDYVLCVLLGTCGNNTGDEVPEYIRSVVHHLGRNKTMTGVVPSGNCGNKSDPGWCDCVYDHIRSMPISSDERYERLADWSRECVHVPTRPCEENDPRPGCIKYKPSDHPEVQCMAGGVTFNCTDPQTGTSFVAPHSIDKYRIGSADGPVHNCSCTPDTSQCEKCGKSQTECLVDAAVAMGYERGMCPGHWYTNPYDGFHQFYCFTAPFTSTYPCSDCL